MLEFKKITDEVTVSPQVSADDMQAVADAGYKSVLCNRPEGEVEDQPKYVDVKQAALALGLEVRFVPIVSGKIGLQDVERFSNAIASLPKPVLAYCRSGTRCAIMWSLSQTGRMDPTDIIAATIAAGYDLEKILDGTAGR